MSVVFGDPDGVRRRGHLAGGVADARRELRAQAGCDELEDPLGTREVFQAVLAEVDAPLVVGEVVLDDVAGRAREEDLAAMPAAEIRAPR